VYSDALTALGPLADICGVTWGGYTSAERRRLLLGREEVLGDADPAAFETVAAVQVKGNFMFDAATHPDFLGACLGTGIDRRKIGDILLLGEQGAQILCTPDIAPFLEMALTQVRGWLYAQLLRVLARYAERRRRCDQSRLRRPWCR